MHRMFRTMVAAAAAIGATLWIGVPAVQAASIGGPFELVDHTGQTVTEESFDDRYLLVYFGYAYCPDICPTELLIMGQAVDEPRRPRRRGLSRSSSRSTRRAIRSSTWPSTCPRSTRAWSG